jgi:hypothetical protein
MSAAIPHYVVDAYLLFQRCEIVELNPKALGNLKTALRKYILPTYGFEAKSLQTDRDLENALGRITLKAFLDAPERLKDSIPVSMSSGTFANYRSAINRFLGWMEQHSWFNEAVGQFGKMLSPTTKKTGLSLDEARKNKGRETSQKSPALSQEELTPRLRQELKELSHFLTAPEVAKRQDNPIRQITLDSYLKLIRGFWGWMYRIVNVSRQELSLALMADREWLDEYLAWGISDGPLGRSLTIAATPMAGP